MLSRQRYSYSYSYSAKWFTELFVFGDSLKPLFGTPLNETFSMWHNMAIELTQEIDRHIAMVTEDYRETTYLFQRLSMALQNRNAVSFRKKT